MKIPENSKGVASLPLNFPYPWCSDYGEDEYGIFMAFTYEGVRQGFRWIPPGTFWMGSPDDEIGRYDGGIREWKETWHNVFLSSGYWLAENTCEQVLWQAVMGKNPSKFHGENRPVDTVSWDETQEFIETLNGWQENLALRLPSEAEWERACRAETKTAYWFGNEINPELVHFDQDSTIGTLPARELERNPWGLYQMHGNVDEWCLDWLAAYPAGSIRDPEGPERGQNRVLRGGSWRDVGDFCRSASRDSLIPEYALHDIGFRLARSK